MNIIPASRFACRRHSILSAMICAATLVALPTAARAATFTWTGTSDGSWSSAANWGGTAPVSANDTALVFDNANQLVTTNDFSGGLTLNSLTLGAASGVRTISGNLLTFDGTAPFISLQNTLGNTGNDQTKIAAPIRMNQTLTVTGGVDGSHQLIFEPTAVFSGAGGLTWAGGTGVIQGTNTYSGATTITAGGLAVLASGAFGASPSVTVQDGGSLQLLGTVTINKPLTLTGTGFATFPALNGAGVGQKTWSGTITLASDVGVEAFNGASLMLSNTVSLGTLTLTTTATANSSVSIFGAITGTGGLTKTGPGALLLTSNANTVPTNTYSGATLVSEGSVVVMRNSAFGSSSAVTVVPGAEIVLQSRTNAAGGAVGGVTVSRPLLLGGTLRSGEPQTGDDNFVQSWSGPITLTGDATVSAKQSGSIPTRSTLAISGTLALAGFTLNAAPDAAVSRNEVRLLGAITGSGALNIVTGPGRVALESNGASTFTGPVFVNGNLDLANGDSFGNVANTVSFQGGSIVTFKGSSAILARPFSVTGSGGLLFIPGNFASTIGANISGNGPVQFSGVGLGTGGVITLTGNNTFTGGLRVGSQTVVVFDGDSRLGAAGEPVVLDGGGLSATVSGTFSAARSLSVGISNGTLAAPLGVSLTVPNDISGTGKLILAGGTGGNLGGTIRLTGTNAQSGGTEIAGATLEIDSDSRLGAASGVFDIGRPNGFSPIPGKLRALGNISIAATRTTLFQNATIDTNGFDVVFNQPAQGVNMTKSGDGSLLLKTVNTNVNPSNVAIEGGVLRLGISEALGGRARVTIAAGGTFDLNNFNQTVEHITGDGPIQLGSGFLTIRGGVFVNGTISGTGGVIVNTGATPAFGGANTFSGGLTVSGDARILVTSPTALGAPGNSILLDGGGIGVSTLSPSPLVIDSSTNLTIGPGGGRFSSEGQTLIISAQLGGTSPIRFSGGSEIAELQKYEVRLTHPANTFTGNIDLGNASDGLGAVLGIVSDGSLGNAANVVTMGDHFFNGETHQVVRGGIRAFADFTIPATRSIRLDGSTAGFNSMGGFIDTNGFNVTIAGAITELSPGMPFAKTGAGTLFLNGTNTYTGETTVLEGTLSGSGTIGKTSIQSGATLAPGNSPGTLHTGDLTLEAGSTLSLEFASPTLADQVSVTGAVTLNGDIELSLSLGYLPTTANVFTIIANDSNDSVETFGGLALFAIGGNQLTEGETFTASGAEWTISYTGGSGNDITLSVIPEPSSSLFLMAGLALMLRRRKRAS
jgi:fibronectin-binding autotransporter adhesin